MCALDGFLQTDVLSYPIVVHMAAVPSYCIKFFYESRRELLAPHGDIDFLKGAAAYQANLQVVENRNNLS